jgi:hypothetical protein
MNIVAESHFDATQLTEAQLAEIKRRRPGVCASFAIEGMTYTPEEEALFAQMDAERLTPDQRTRRIVEFCRERSPSKTPA